MDAYEDDQVVHSVRHNRHEDAARQEQEGVHVSARKRGVHEHPSRGTRSGQL